MSLQLQEVFYLFIFYPLPQPSSAQELFSLHNLELVSCVFWFNLHYIIVPSQFLALGTHFGKVFLLDIQGNVTQKFEIVSTL